MLDSLDDGFMQADPDLTLLVRSDGTILSRIGGELDDTIGPQDAAAHTLEQLWSPDVAHALRQLVRRALKDCTSLERKYRDRGRCHGVSVRPQGIGRVLMMFRELADDDSIGITPEASRARPLASRAQLMRVLSLALSRARLRERRLAVITIHLGGLTDIERAFDVTVCEQLVDAAAQRLHTSISRERATFMRSGPGETGYVAPIADHVLAAVIEGSPTREALRTIAIAMREALVQPFDLLGRNLHVSPVFGIAIAPEDSTDARELLDRARSAMRDAHCAEHAVAFHSDTLRLRALSRLDSEHELRWALEHEQFRLRYRPLYALSGERLFAVQAEPCWTHPVRGNVEAAEFLALAETSEIARDIGRWMLSRAIADMIRAANVTTRAIVTLCRRHVLSTALLTDVSEAIDAAGAGPPRFALKISERTLTSSGQSWPRLAELRAAGVQVIVERFGAGHIAMERIADLPVDAVSLEPMLFENLQRDERLRRVCRSVIEVAHALGWLVGADDVSHDNERTLLRELGCDFVGGGLFGAAQDLAPLLKRESDRSADLQRSSASTESESARAFTPRRFA